MATPSTISRWVIYTDLDGTLLDHHSYSWAAARPALERLREQRIPVVLTSSKTFPELVTLAAEIGLAYPIIGENGAFVAWPDAFQLPASPDNASQGHRFKYFGSAHAAILSVLQKLRENPAFLFSGFSDWTVDELVGKTGLSAAAAAQARQRQASEPILWQGEESVLEDFRSALEEAGLVLVKGGRFHHVMGPTSKRQAMEWLNRQLAQQCGEAPFFIALGDGPNDLEMLDVADVSVVVANPDSDDILPRAHSLIRTQGVGPVGWNEAIIRLLEDSNNNGNSKDKNS